MTSRISGVDQAVVVIVDAIGALCRRRIRLVIIIGLVTLEIVGIGIRMTTRIVEIDQAVAVVIVSIKTLGKRLLGRRRRAGTR